MDRNETLGPEEALDYACAQAKARGAQQYDAVAGESESMGLELFEGKVKSTEISNSRGIGLRVFKDGRPGFAFTERLTRGALDQTLDDAFAHAKLTDPVDLELPDPESLDSLDLGQYNPELENLTLESMKALGLELEAVAKAADARIENVPYLGVSKSSGMSRVQNSKGVRYGSRSNVVSAGLGAVARDGDAKKMGVYSRGGRSFAFDARFMAETAVSRALELLGAEPLPSGTLPVVFSNRVSGQIFSMFSSPFFAEAVQKGQSRLADKVGEAIAVPQFNLTSDPLVPGWPGSHHFDGEGVRSRKLDVVKDGVLRTYLYNLESAKKAGVAPTGTGARGYSGKAGTGFANYVVEAGQAPLEDLLARHERCFLVVKLEGGSGCSAVSGEISIGAQGFLVEKGKKVRPVDRVTLSTNFFDLLKNVEAFGSEYNDAFSSVKVPDVLVTGIHVAG